MAKGLNKVMLIGNVGKDPEVKYTPAGAAICNFSVATNESYKDKQGNQQDRTEWHRIVTFNRTAEVMGEYLKKGQQVYVEGKIQTRSWDDDKGVKRYATEIIALTVQFLGGKSSDSQTSSAPTGNPAEQENFDYGSGTGGENLPF